MPGAGEAVSRVAFVDESMIAAPEGATYILAAVVLSSDDLDEARRQMSGLKPKKAKKLHWRDSNGSARLFIAQAISKLPATGCVVIRSQHSGQTQERQRRLCLERLLFELRALEVTGVVVESRGPADDRRDLAMLQMLRSRRIVDGTLRMEHCPGPREPLLWAADVLCGVVSHAEAAPQSAYQDLISITEIHRLLA
ncbi:hypothetical protein [Arthrobacter woluwensis]|uniref:hypothetical protein n=1 Tax=Arthrobacter woluwensis TaxID=156980 RepID=UPI001AAEB1B0|nr:hypothetical protein [Arthrobacter woluwensis]QTF72087.1 DUF3800 domain-containing protein [Arthrobacter woluwensis]